MNNSENKTDLPAISFSGEICLVTNDQELAKALEELESAKELGFDTESRPSFKKGEIHPVALLQFSTEKRAYLLRLRGITHFQHIKEILENRNILKVGVAIRDDLKSLQKIFKFTPQNFVELQTLAKEKGLKNFGLKGMAEEVLQARLSKRSKMTNWDARILTDQQLMYAATDAWIGLHLFKTISDPQFVSQSTERLEQN